MYYSQKLTAQSYRTAAEIYEITTKFSPEQLKKASYYINFAWIEKKVDFSSKSLSTVLHLSTVLDSFMIIREGLSTIIAFISFSWP